MLEDNSGNSLKLRKEAKDSRAKEILIMHMEVAPRSNPIYYCNCIV